MAPLVYVIGPSGAGKDSILDYARRNKPPGLPIVFADRCITRPADSGGEVHIALSEDEFARRLAGGEFALSWDGNGLRYGVGREINLLMRSGLAVIVNGSRAYLAEAARRYPNLHPVLVQASPEILVERLRRRGRESGREIAARMDRGDEFEVKHERLVTIINDGALAFAGMAFLRYVQWLCAADWREGDNRRLTERNFR